MANYSNLKAAISAAIKTNGNQEITGQVLQDVLNSIVSVIGANYTFAGVATPSTNPGTPDQNVVYMASQAGTYTNFGNVSLSAGLTLLMWNGTWNSQTIMSLSESEFDTPAKEMKGFSCAGNNYNVIDSMLRNFEGFQEVKKEITQDESNLYIGNVNLKKNETFTMIVRGSMEASRVVIASTRNLAYRFFDITGTWKKDYTLIAEQNVSYAYLYASGVTAGTIEVIFLTGKAQELYNSLTFDVRRLFNLNQENLIRIIVDGLFISPTAGYNKNSYYSCCSIPVVGGESYSISVGERFFTCFFNSSGTYISGGEDSRTAKVVTVPSNAVLMTVSFITGRKSIACICKSATVKNINDIQSTPSPSFGVYSKQEIDFMLNGGEIIEVGTGKTFTSVHDAFAYAAARPNKVRIKIYDGDYDYYTEMGGSTFISSVSGTATWDEILPTFTKGVEIEGIGDVTIRMQIPSSVYSSYGETCSKISIINTKGSISVKNVTLIAENCRYAIHDECTDATEYNEGKHEFKNINVTTTECFAGLGFGASTSEYIFDNIYVNDTSSRGHRAIYLHTWSMVKGANITIKNSVFFGNLMFYNYNSSRNTVKILSSMMTSGELYISTEDATNYYTNQFDISVVNCNFSQVTVASSITSNPYVTQFYNW